MARHRISAVERLAIRQWWAMDRNATYESMAELTGRPLSTLHSIIKPVASRPGDVNAKMRALWCREAENDGIAWDRACLRAAAIKSAWFKAWGSRLSKPAKVAS